MHTGNILQRVYQSYNTLQKSDKKWERIFNFPTSHTKLSHVADTF